MSILELSLILYTFCSKSNDAFFKLGGTLTQTDVPMEQRLKYVEKLCELTGDREVNNRVSCIERQQEKF